MIKNSIKKVCLFLMGFIVIDIVLLGALLIFCNYFRSEEYSLAKNYPESEFLIFGTSHAQESFVSNALSDEIKKSVYNFGRARRNIFFNYYLSVFLIDQARKPDHICIVMSYNDFRETTRPYMVSQFVPKGEGFSLFYSLLIQKKWTSMRNFFYTDLFSSSYRMMISRSMSWLKNRKREIPYWEDAERGYRGDDSILSEYEEPEEFPTHKFKAYSMQKEYLINTIRLWKNAGCNVIITDTPEFIGTRLSEIEYEQYSALMEKIASEEGATFKSFNDPKIGLLSDHTSFKDGGWGVPNSHLNKKGANQFTKLFAQWLISISKDK